LGVHLLIGDFLQEESSQLRSLRSGCFGCVGYVLDYSAEFSC